VGYTEKPAMYWPTPWSVRRELLETGFARTYNRWELLRSDQKDGWKGRAIDLACNHATVRTMGDTVLPGLVCLAVK